MISRRHLIALPALAALPLRSAFAQEYPARPIRIIVPTGPGTGTDATARHMSAGLLKAWNTPVIVENKLGAGGVIGTDFVAKAAPDGYTLLFTYASHYSNQWIEPTPYDAVKDFEPIARLATSALVLVTGPNSPFKTVHDVVNAAKQKPGTISYGSAGTGTTSQMAAELLSSMAGIKLNHIPYKAPGQAAIDAAAGQVDISFGGLATQLPLIKAGRLRAIAVTTTTRSMNLPDVPTIAESGYPGYENSSPIWALAPRGTPQAITTKLSDTLVRLASTQEFKDFCFAQGFEVDVQNAAAFRAAAPAELEKWRRLVALTAAKK
ncbi:MAG: tripartite tricarboxylate transporter substrate binding protein [Pseudomonadota bacterium]